MKFLIREKAFSQILTLIIMGVLAIGLPTSVKLVQRTQENRSSARVVNDIEGNDVLAPYTEEEKGILNKIINNFGKDSKSSSENKNGNIKNENQESDLNQSAASGSQIQSHEYERNAGEESNNQNREENSENNSSSEDIDSNGNVGDESVSTDEDELVVNNDGNQLKFIFRVAFAGVKLGNPCLNNFKQVGVTIRNSDVKQNFIVNLNLVEGEANINGLQIFESNEIELGDVFTGSDDFYVEVKGSSHKKMLYCENGQKNQCSDGDVSNLNLNGAINNFSSYPVLAGDVNEDNIIDDKDIGIINRDFASMVEGCGYKTDLNGDGRVNGQDFRLIIESMSNDY